MTTKEPQAIDFSAYLLKPMSQVEIDLPNGEPMLGPNGQRVVAHVHGPGSEEFARASANQARGARENLFNKKGKFDEKISLEADAKFLETITASIENFPYPGGAAAIFRERALGYIGDQIRAFVGDSGNFFKPSKAA